MFGNPTPIGLAIVNLYNFIVNYRGITVSPMILVGGFTACFLQGVPLGLVVMGTAEGRSWPCSCVFWAMNISE